ncbi:hypothetical protein LCGC14_1268550 [marine sediment metagenome]|uniref:Uncharacterized protein n=1 Tax=marine sediment metagenome TaxID=412755 RepID=A0A0F9L0L1_9ZZZZ
MRKVISVLETRNGWLVVEGDAHGLSLPIDLASKSWSFNSLDAAIARIRRILKSWKEVPETELTKKAKQE